MEFSFPLLGGRQSSLLSGDGISVDSSFVYSSGNQTRQRARFPNDWLSCPLSRRMAEVNQVVKASYYLLVFRRRTWHSTLRMSPRVGMRSLADWRRRLSHPHRSFRHASTRSCCLVRSLSYFITDCVFPKANALQTWTAGFYVTPNSRAAVHMICIQ